MQKAYADIILNTAKEAAARIMMSERKAQRFQRELQVAKDEGLRMLLRLKQMMDSKVKFFGGISRDGFGLVWVSGFEFHHSVLFACFFL